jgi:thymidylate synthase (FAD)
MEVTYIDNMGSDLSVVNAARVSFGKEATWQEEDNTCQCFPYAPGDCCCGNFLRGDGTGTLREGDVKLIKYLATHDHFSPFTHPQITLRYKVPIFVARQEFKHIVGFTRNEVSRRYVDDTPEMFIPTKWRGRPTGGAKQGSSGELSGFKVEQRAGSYLTYIENAVFYYEQLLEAGVAPEMARMVLPQSMYTEYYITGSLAAFARMVSLRSDAHAQVEIQQLAQMVSDIIEPLYPNSWKALVENK